jgi:hypothetical protein
MAREIYVERVCWSDKTRNMSFRFVVIYISLNIPYFHWVLGVTFHLGLFRKTNIREQLEQFKHFNQVGQRTVNLSCCPDIDFAAEEP